MVYFSTPGGREVVQFLGFAEAFTIVSTVLLLVARWLDARVKLRAASVLSCSLVLFGLSNLIARAIISFPPTIRAALVILSALVLLFSVACFHVGLKSLLGAVAADYSDRLCCPECSREICAGRATVVECIGCGARVRVESVLVAEIQDCTSSTTAL